MFVNRRVCSQRHSSGLTLPATEEVGSSAHPLILDPGAPGPSGISVQSYLPVRLHRRAESSGRAIWFLSLYHITWLSVVVQHVLNIDEGVTGKDRNTLKFPLVTE